MRGERGFGPRQVDWPLSPELAVSCRAGHWGARCTGLMAWLRTEEMSVTPFLGERLAYCPGEVAVLCRDRTGQFSGKFHHREPGRLWNESSPVGFTSWPRMPPASGDRWGHLGRARGHCHRRARAFVVEAAAERLGEKGGRVRRAPGCLPRGTLRLAPCAEGRTSVTCAGCHHSVRSALCRHAGQQGHCQMLPQAALHVCQELENQSRLSARCLC